MIFIIISLLHVRVYIYYVHVYCTDRKYATPPHARSIYTHIYKGVRGPTEISRILTPPPTFATNGRRAQEPTLAASTDFNPYRLQRWRWPTAAQSSVTRQRTTAHHRPSTIASPSCQPHNISIDIFHHNII